MTKVKARFRVRTKGYYYTDKYKTKTFNVELPISDFQPLMRYVDMTALTKIIEDLIDAEYPETYNKLLSITF